MAEKINWTFQNESGTNLNRYKAINVDTGEEIIFDLFRNCEIKTIGTDLSAENLNQLITAINENYTEIIALKNNVTTNANNIKALQSSVSTNTTNIEILTQKVTNLENTPSETITRRLIFNPLTNTMADFKSNLVFKQSNRYIVELAGFPYSSTGSVVLKEDYEIYGQIVIDIPKLTNENASIRFEAGTVSSTSGALQPRYIYITGYTSGISTSLTAYYVALNATNRFEIKDFSETITIGRIWEEKINII